MAFERSGSRVGAGQSTVMAMSEAAEAMPQPARRSGIDEIGPAKVTGRMNASSIDVVAPAITELTTAEKSTRNATAAIAAVQSQVARAASVPRQTRTRTHRCKRCLGPQAIVRRAREVDEQQEGEGSEGGEGSDDRVADDLVAEGEHRRHDDRRPAGATKCGISTVVFAHPLRSKTSIAATSFRSNTGQVVNLPAA